MLSTDNFDFKSISVYFPNVTSTFVRFESKEIYVKNTFSAILAVSALIIIGLACNASTANMSSLKIAKDKDGKQEATTFKPGDTIYALATISNSPGKVTVKFRLKADEVAGTPKGEVIKGSEVPVELPSSGVATYSLPIPVGVSGGKYTLEVDMHNDAGEKKDGKTATITIDAPSDGT